MTPGEPDAGLLGADRAWDDAARLTAVLLRRGVQPSDRVAFVASPSTAVVSAVLGVAAAGMVPVMVNPSLLPHERTLLLDDAEPTTVLDDAALGELVDQAATVTSSQAAAAARGLADVPLVRPMHYTSGTSGRPKGVYGGVLDLDRARAAVADECEVWRFHADDVYLAAGPLYHSAPLRFAIGTLLAGGRVRVLPRWSAQGFADAVAAGVTTTFIAPTPLQRLLNAVRDRAVRLDPSGFRLLAHAGAPCPHPVKERAMELFPPSSVWEFYGSTEGQFTVCSSAEWLARPGTVGRARPHREISVDSTEVIWCRPPDHARFTYWRNDPATEAAWRRDGPGGAGEWFTVGDLGRMDAEGYLWISSRREDLIISGGVNVYPVEVEQALSRMPGIREVAVFGVPDPEWGQRVCAAVVGDVGPEQVHAFAEGALAGYKRPKSVHLVPELPVSPNGKVLHRRLTEQFGG